MEYKFSIRVEVCRVGGYNVVLAHIDRTGVLPRSRPASDPMIGVFLDRFANLVQFAHTV